MRDLKFRAWDKDNEKMVYTNKVPWEYDFSMNTEGNLVCSINCCYSDTFGDEHDDWEELDNIMQSTGLPDCNGKEIYEGDIVKATKHESYPTTKEVVWRNGGLWFGNWNWIEFQNAFRNLEVIGNIYENPELLNT